MKNNFKPHPQQITKLLTRFTQKELADIFQVSTRTIRRRTKPPKPPQKRGQKSKITGEALDLLLSYTSYSSRHNILTQKEMANSL